MTTGSRLGVIVPCRNEAVVIERKLRNLALGPWPASDRPHRIVAVDDGSRDDTCERARIVGPQLFTTAAVRLDVISNAGPPGKAGAVTTGVRELADDVDCVVLTDADVVFRPGALCVVAEALARRPDLGMVCGSQEFVAALADDGRPTGPDGGEPLRVDGLYDRWTAAVRALESRSGRVFSVHGQLLAWPARLELVPRAGVAADDIDLMVQVRRRGMRVEKLEAARFLEVRAAPGPERAAQRLRRARAYVQVAPRCRLPPSAPLADRLQFLLYRRVPPAAPWLVPTLALALLALAWWLGGTLPVTLVAGLLVLAGLSPPGRRLQALLRVIAAARTAETRQSLGDRWEMARR